MMNTKLPPLLVTLTLVGLIFGATSTGRTLKTEPLQERPDYDIAFEETQTAKLLGVPLQKFLRNGAFIIRTDSSWVGGDSAKPKEWLLRPTQ